MTPNTEHQSKVLESYRKQSKYDFWTESKTLGDASHIMVGPEHQTLFEIDLNKHGFDFRHLVSDVQKYVVLQVPANKQQLLL